MTSISIEVKNQGITQAIKQSPVVLTKHLRLAILRSIIEMARLARGNAPKAYSTLTQSINHRMIDDLTGEVAPHVDYARMVEEGTGPGGFPPEDVLMRWISVKGITPRDPTMDIDDLAYVIARSIALHGIPKHPYMIPAFDAKKTRAAALCSQAVDNALQELQA